MTCAAQRYYSMSSRELKRLDSISRSPVYSHFSETLTGMPTIRAYNASERMASLNASRLDDNQRVYFVFMAINRWMSIRLEVLGGLMILAAASFAVMSRHQV